MFRGFAWMLGFLYASVGILVYMAFRLLCLVLKTVGLMLAVFVALLVVGLTFGNFAQGVATFALMANSMRRGR